MLTNAEVTKQNTLVIERDFSALVGKTVGSVRAMTISEADGFAWSIRYGTVPFVIQFTDGTVAVPMSDAEGNDPGALLVDWSK
jgi:hypothetical protein